MGDTSPPKYPSTGDEESDDERQVPESNPRTDAPEEEADQTTALLGSIGRNERISKHRKPVLNTTQFITGLIYETVPPLMFTVTGLLLTGQLLEQITTWKAFRTINELFILVPMVNNLKGNLEMNLSSRLSTAANIGQLDSRAVRYSLLLGNLTLLQVQAALVSALAALLSFLLGLVLPPSPSMAPTPNNITQLATRELLPGNDLIAVTFDLVTRTKPIKIHHPGFPASGVKELLIVLTTAMSSACLSSLILGSFMCSLVVICRKMRLDPDNIAPPIASALGDLLTLTLLGLTSSFLVTKRILVLLAVLSTLIGIFVLSFILTFRNNHVRKLLWTGWTPLLVALTISSGTGMVLDNFVGRYMDFAILAIAIGGLPGGAGSILISRLSTALHAQADSYEPSTPITPTSSSFLSLTPPNSRPILAATTLFLICIPVQMGFIAFVYFTGWITLPGVFTFAFMLFFCGTVVASLAISTFLTLFLWSRSLDPDAYAMPIQSSLVDLIGQTMLVACFEFVRLVLGKDVTHKA